MSRLPPANGEPAVATPSAAATPTPAPAARNVRRVSRAPPMRRRLHFRLRLSRRESACVTDRFGAMALDPSAAPASDQRRARILELVRSHDFVRVADLGEMLGVSSVTVRGDLDVLAARGELRRIRGGAVSQEPRRAAEDRRSEERSIAQLAAGLVNDDECVF